MEVKQLYTECLAEATYYIQSEGEAVIIDPLRETEPYLKKLQKDKAKLKYIFLTHFHADFVSGHVDLSRETGAKIVIGPTANADFYFHQGADNEEFKIGNLTLKLIHTPGHTLESSSFLLFDERGKEHCLFSGDTLFIGDVGRPDLAISSSISKEDLAAKLYNSLHDKILKLPDDIIIYPNHGKGSACGKNMGSATFDTLKNQRKENYALNPNLKEKEFIQQVLDGLTTPPQYFSKNAKMNTQINRDVNEVISTGLSSISIDQLLVYTAVKDVLLLDVRSIQEFSKEHIPYSTFIGLDGSFAPWVGALVRRIEKPIIIITPKGREKETVTRLSRIGYDNIIGYLCCEISEWRKRGFATSSVSCISANSNELLKKKTVFIDVRRKDEYQINHIANSIHIPLKEIYNNTKKLEKNTRYYVYCAGGYRSLIASSILKKMGFKDIVNINGGFSNIIKSKIPLKYCRNNCPSCQCSY